MTKLDKTLFAALALTVANGCTMDVDDGEGDQEALGEAISQSVTPTYILCSSGAHPTTPAGNVVLARDASDNITAQTATACAVMGLVSVNPTTNQAFEVAADTNLVGFAGKGNAITCGTCLQWEQNNGGPGPNLGGGGFGSGGSGGSGGSLPPPPSSGSGPQTKKGSSAGSPMGSRIAYPTDVVSVGYLGGYPWNWHFSSAEPPYNSTVNTSFCDAPYYTDFGPLTNAFGFERVDTGSSTAFGDNAYQMYAVTPWGTYVRAASVHPTYGYLTYVPRTDYCEP